MSKNRGSRSKISRLSSDTQKSFRNGGSDRTRTCDPRLIKAVL